jgi:hypothetical protein
MRREEGSVDRSVGRFRFGRPDCYPPIPMSKTNSYPVRTFILSSHTPKFHSLARSELSYYPPIPHYSSLLPGPYSRPSSHTPIFLALTHLSTTQSPAAAPMPTCQPGRAHPYCSTPCRPGPSEGVHDPDCGTRPATKNSGGGPRASGPTRGHLLGISARRQHHLFRRK